ncbi:MAG: hypothetical protein R3Y08_01515 [Rikenellaceae bacterium]
MKGLRKRVSVGFLSIAILLFVSGVIAFFELNTLSHDTKSILSVNSRKMELAHQMLNTLQTQDMAFVQMTLFGESGYDTICLRTISELNHTIQVAKSEISNPHMLDSLAQYLTELQLLTHTISTPAEFDTLHTDSLQTAAVVVDRAAYYDSYRPIHANIVKSIYSFTTSSFKSIEPRAEQLQRNAYRAVTPVLISLVVMIAIVLMLYYFMIIYCVNPIVRLNRSVGDFITYRLPFAPKADCRDEVAELQEKIETMTSQIRRECNK